MSITNSDQLDAAIATSQDLRIYKAQGTAPAVGFWQSLFADNGNPSAGSLSIGNTTNGVVPTDATAGAWPINAFTGDTGYLGSFSGIGTQTGTLMLYDRIFHAGSFVTSALTTLNLTSQPSFSGRVPGSNWAECEIWLEINAASGATATTAQVNYQDGTAAGGAAQNTVVSASLSSYPTKRMIPLAMANNTGCQRINSITIGGATGTATINVVVMRPLARVGITAANIASQRLDWYSLGGQILFADSCLALMHLGAGTTAGNYWVDCQIING